MSDEMVQETTETVVAADNVEAPAVSQSDVQPESALVAPAAAAESAPAQPAAARTGGDHADDELYSMANYDRSLRQLQEGDVISGTVMSVDRDAVLVDVGAKSEGIIRLNELSRDSSANPEDLVKVGDSIRVFVLEPENQDGNPILSKKRADFEQAWEKVQHSLDIGETLHAMVTDRVKGGLVVDLGIRGFVPASHVGNGSLKTNLDKYVGQSISLKVIEVDKERRKVVLSNKLAVLEEREAKSHETKNSLAPGQTRHGVVRRLTNYGAFIDLGGIDGLLHMSEMSCSRINDPKVVLREGQELDVLVLKMDLENNRVSLGLRQILPDPWTAIPDRHKEGDEITGKVTRIVPFGTFVEVDGGVEGIIPHPELPRSRAGKPAVPLVAGEEVTVKILSIRPEERKMTLSMRALQAPEDRDAPAPREAGEAAARPPKRGRVERDDREEYGRFTPGRQEEPRFNQVGEAFAAAKRTERTKRDRRPSPEDEIDEFEGLEEEVETENTHTEEPTGETDGETEA